MCLAYVLALKIISLSAASPMRDQVRMIVKGTNNTCEIFISLLFTNFNGPLYNSCICRHFYRERKNLLYSYLRGGQKKSQNYLKIKLFCMHFN